MKELVPMNEYGIFADAQETMRVDSRFVARYFGKRHDNVLSDIKRLDCSDQFRLLNFKESKYINAQGKKKPCYSMTRDGFTFLAMGYRGEKAAHFKELYIRQFNAMEGFIKTLQSARADFPLLTENIKLLHENPRPYHFSNECDLINKLATGMNAKQFRLAHSIEKGQSIRPYLTEKEAFLLDALQKADIGLLLAVPDYAERKNLLERYKDTLMR